MVEPEYAINFINITTQVTATIIGFLVIFWIFWYENIGKKLSIDFGRRMIGKKFIRIYTPFEQKFLKNLLKRKIRFCIIW